MNNIEKNTYVKGQITQAMINLLEQRELNDISISEMTAIAQVSRISFYRNYTDKEDVLKKYLDQIFSQSHRNNNPKDNISEDQMLSGIFGHLNEYKEFYLLLSKRNLLYLLKDILNEICGPKPEYPNFAAYTAAFISYGLYGWIEEWFSRGMQESAEEMEILLKNRI